MSEFDCHSRDSASNYGRSCEECQEGRHLVRRPRSGGVCVLRWPSISSNQSIKWRRDQFGEHIAGENGQGDSPGRSVSYK